MPLQIVGTEITKLKADAIVAVEYGSSPLNDLSGTIYSQAGRSLAKKRQALGECPVGYSVITSSGNLPCKYIIHTSIPQSIESNDGLNRLSMCYDTVFSIAKDKGCRSVAIPLLYKNCDGYNKEKSLKTAVDYIKTFLAENDMTVYLVINDKKTYQINDKLLSDVTYYININWESFQCSIPDEMSVGYKRAQKPLARRNTATADNRLAARKEKRLNSDTMLLAEADLSSLAESLENIDESFSEMLLRKIDGSGMTDSECYKKANIDRRLFSKIRSDKSYRPSKPTVLAFSVALELSLEETKEMLMKAGFALSHSNKFDIIIEYFIKEKIYDIYQINETLFEFDQPLLGL